MKFRIGLTLILLAVLALVAAVVESNKSPSKPKPDNSLVIR